MEVLQYSAEYKAEWDAFVRSSKNATFMLERSYMDYHSDRFTDASLLLRRQGKTLALLPATRSGENVSSHAGLTYAGFITDQKMTMLTMLDCMDLVLGRYKSEGAASFHYKAIPHIYHRIPAEEDLYALFAANATLVRRDVSTAIPIEGGAKMSAGAVYSAKLAARSDLRVEESTDLGAFWRLLEDGLSERHKSKPTHSLAEMQLLQSRFSKQIRLFNCYDPEGIVAGILAYDCGVVLHTQYIASNARGKKLGAVQAIVMKMMDEHFPLRRYLDFGHSNEDAGRRLNQGLIGHKEAYGGRAVVYDQYEIDLRAYQSGQCNNVVFNWQNRPASFE